MKSQASIITTNRKQKAEFVELAIQTRTSATRQTRKLYALRDLQYRLNQRQQHILLEVGRFRIIAEDDLLETLYSGESPVFERDLDHLRRQHLVKVWGWTRRYVFLTGLAQELTKKYLCSDSRQLIYSGRAARLNHADHDAALYHIYVQVAEEIRARGEEPLRVEIGLEIRRRVNHERRKLQFFLLREHPARIREIAQHEGLKVVREKIPIPGLRIEYETAQGTLAFCDLEYVPAPCRARVIAEKQAAGFRVFREFPPKRPLYSTTLKEGTSL